MVLSAKERHQWAGAQAATGTRGSHSRTADRGSVVFFAILVKVLLLGVLGFVLMTLGGTRFQTSGCEGQPVKATTPANRDAL